MEAEDELHSELKKGRHICAVTICQHSRRGGSNDRLVAAGLAAGQQGRKVNPPTQVNPPTPPYQQQSSDSAPTAESMSATLAQGKFYTVMWVWWFVLIAPPAFCGCSTWSVGCRLCCLA